jgi:hypothetical protein
MTSLLALLFIPLESGDFHQRHHGTLSDERGKSKASSLQEPKYQQLAECLNSCLYLLAYYGLHLRSGGDVCRPIDE